MLISVRHLTRYTYASPARFGVLSLRLTPPSFAGQAVRYWTIKAPSIENAVRFRDAYGNTTHLVAIGEMHDEVTIEASGLIDTEDRAGMTKGLGEVAQPRIYLRQTPSTMPDEAIRTLAEKARGKASKGDGTLALMHALMHTVGEAMEFEVGATHAHTTAAEALAEGRGVCQDYAHILVAAARTLAVPARYVSGYLATEGSTHSEAAHAWAEAWIDGLGWIGFDAANDLCPTDRYVRVAAGLDSTGAAPIRGSRQGGEHQSLDVVVEVQQQGSQQQ
jgi:transglutaminase-like putative cysteine protease